MLRRQLIRRKLDVPTDRHHSTGPVCSETPLVINAVTEVTTVTMALTSREDTFSNAAIVTRNDRPSKIDGNNGDTGDQNLITHSYQILKDAGASPQVPEKPGTLRPGVAPIQWFRGVARLQFMRFPHEFTKTRWLRLQFDSASLLDDHGDDLYRLGWSDVDVFGIHPTRPDAVHCFGLATSLNGGRVVEVTLNEATISRSTGSMLHFQRNSRPEAIPSWALSYAPG